MSQNNFKNFKFIIKLNELICFFLLFCLISTTSAKAQQASLSSVSVENSSEGFVISGKVNSTDLNPEKQIVESDYLSVFAEIPTESNFSFPLLWESMVIRPPAEAETPYKKGDKFLSKIELNGENIETVKILGSTAIRKTTVWRAYGGLNEWRKNAPDSVETEFEGIIPIEYSGKQIRLRATLKHTFGGPYAAWSAYTFAHDTTQLTLDKSPASDPKEANDSQQDNNDKSAEKKPNNQVSDKVKDVVNAAISIFKNKKNKAQTTKQSQTDKIEMTSFPEPEASDTKNSSQQAEKIKQIVEEVIQKNQLNSDNDDTFQKKYWFNKNFLDPFIDKVSGYIPIGKYYKDYIKSDKDNQLFNKEEKIKKTALDYNVDKTSANYFNKYNKIIDQEKKYSTLKNAVPETKATKAFSWLLDKIGWGAKKQYAHSLGKEYKYIRQEIKTYTNKTGMSRDEAVKRVKDDYVGFQGDYGNGSFGQIDTGIKWWGSKGKYQQTGARFDDMVKDMIKNKDI